MLIALSKPGENGKRHVVLVCEGNDVIQAGPVIAAILGPKYRPVRRYNAVKRQYRYLFNLYYLDMLLLAFPSATKSTGLQRHLDRLHSRELDKRRVPPFAIPGLWDRQNDCKAVPFDYQYLAIADCVKWLSGEMDAKKVTEHFLENDEMGLGKTLIALSALLILKKRVHKRSKMHVLIVAPKNGKFVWERENLRWAGFDYELVDADKMTPAKRSIAIKRRATLTIVNPEMLRGQERTSNGEKRFIGKHPELFDFEYDYIIVDEYHRFGSPSSQQTKGLLNLHGRRWLPMSGTPYMNRPEQIWPIMNRCWPHMFPDYDMFVRAISVYETKASRKTIGYNPLIMKDLKDFMNPRSIRRRKDQVLKDLPEKQIMRVPVELTREQRRLYNKIRDEFIMILDSGEHKKITDVLPHIMRLKQACFSPELYGGSKHSAKIEELHAAVEQLVASGEKAIIGSEWSKATKILYREFEKYNPAYVDGSVTGKNRMLQADRFNKDPNCHLYIGTIGANKESVSLGAATHVILTDKDWSPFINDQFIARSAAGGLRGLNSVVEHVTVLDLYGVDTYEERIEEMLNMKRDNFNAFIENDGGEKVNKSVLTNIRDLI